MDLRIFDEELTPLGVVDEMASLTWTIMYFNVGSFKLLAPFTENNVELLKAGRIVVKHDEYIDYMDANDHIWRRGAVITYVHYTRDNKGQEQIEVSGQMLSYWLNKRVISPQLQLNGTSQQVVNRLILKNIGSGAAVSRRFPQFISITQEDLGGSSFDYSNEEYKLLGDEIRDVCQGGKIGYDILIDEKSATYGFYLYDGKNLTQANTDGNEPCIFSIDFDNVNSQEFEDDISNIKNYAYVLGAPDDQDNRDLVEVDRDSASGLDLIETYIDAADIQRQAENSSGERVDIPSATYRAMLRSKGVMELASSVENYTFNSSINLNSNLKYKEDFDLGDRVTCIDRKWGVTINSRITEIVQTFEEGKKTIEATFGESAPNLLEKIKKAR